MEHISRLSTRKTSVSSPLSLRGSTSFAKGGFRTSRLNDISSSPVSLVSSLCASPVKLSSCKHSSSSGIRNGSFVIRNGIGFTLVELMIVIAIIGVLAASLFPMMSGYMAKAMDTAKKATAIQLRTVFQGVQNDIGGPFDPTTLGCVDGVKGYYAIGPQSNTGASPLDGIQKCSAFDDFILERMGRHHFDNIGRYGGFLYSMKWPSLPGRPIMVWNIEKEENIISADCIGGSWTIGGSGLWQCYLDIERGPLKRENGTYIYNH